MEFKPECGMSIYEAANEMIKLANEHSVKVFGKFNNVDISANPGDLPSSVTSMYFEGTKRRYEEWASSPEGQAAKKARDEATKIAAAAATEDIKEFSVIDKEGWNLFVSNNNDTYRSVIVRYIARWANLMEEKMSEGYKLEEIAEKTGFEADLEGISGFMYASAISVLASCWEHGEALRRWHNLDAQLGSEGEKANEDDGVINPAILCVEISLSEEAEL